MKKSVTLSAYAKINLFLDVISKRSDGYHNIDGVMQTVSLCDTVTVSAENYNETVIALSCSSKELPCDVRNLAYRAAERFLTAFEITDKKIRIHIEKRIPISAGLAGGSTDAAAVLEGLAQIFSIEKSSLFDIAKELGADVPFCLLGGTARTEGIGELLTPLSPMSYCAVLIAKKGEGVSTPAAFSELDSALSITENEVRHADVSAILTAIDRSPSELSKTLYNAFHDVILSRHGDAQSIARIIKSSGALAVQLSGSGPSVLGIYDDPDAAEKAAEELRKIGAEAFVTTPINK